MNFLVSSNNAGNTSKVIECGIECIIAVSRSAKTLMFDMEGHHHHHYCSHGKESKKAPGISMSRKIELLVINGVNILLKVVLSMKIK